MGHLFRGYVVFRIDEGGYVLGCAYGKVIVDAHRYPHDVALSQVYDAFLQTKISEGFVPRGDLTFNIPPGRAANPIDLDEMVQAYIRLFGGG